MSAWQGSGGLDHRRDSRYDAPFLGRPSYEFTHRMSFLALIIRNVLRRRVRTALTVAGIAIAIGAVVALLGIARMFQATTLSVYQGRGVDVIVERAGALDALTSVLDSSIKSKIAHLPGVADVATALYDVVAFEEFNLFRVVVNGWEPGSFLFDDLKWRQGRALAPDDAHRVALGHRLAAALGKKAGDTVEIYEEPFEVVGVFESFNLENDGIVLPLAELQRLIDRPGKANNFFVRAQGAPDLAGMKTLCQTIKDVAPSLSARPTPEYVENNAQLQAAQGMAAMTSMIAILAGAIGMLNTMVMSIFERTREMGVLRAVGWRRGRVLRMILAESVFLSFSGALIGSLLAALAVWLLSYVPPASSLLDGRLPLAAVVQGFVVALFVGVAGGLLPAIRAASVLPTEALHHE